MAVAMFLGWTLGQCVSWDFSRLLGGGILICLGCWVVGQELGKDKEMLHTNKCNRSEILITEEVGEKKNCSRTGFLYFFKKILMEPQEADLDNSGSINSKEAFFLGLALASDAFGAGIGVALTGFNPWVTSLMVGVSKFFLISLGLFWGHLSREKISLFPAHFLAGGLLILLGIFNIL
jgi:putative sporulation protein YtaF